jgi:hypothetical protein
VEVTPGGGGSAPTGALAQGSGAPVASEAGAAPVEVAPGSGSSLPGALAQAAGGSVQQVAQLLSLTGSALDLAATLLTVSVAPGEFGAGTVATVGSTGVGQGPGQARDDGSGGSGDEPGAEPPGADEAAAAAVSPPAWERLSSGLERAWEEARAAARALWRGSPTPGDREPSSPSAPSAVGAPAPRPAAAPAASRTEAPSRPAPAAAAAPAPPGAPSDRGPEEARRVHDAALEELVAEREEPSARRGRGSWAGLAKVPQPDAVSALVVVVGSAATAGAAWKLRAHRLRRRAPRLPRASRPAATRPRPRGPGSRCEAPEWTASP